MVKKKTPFNNTTHTLTSLWGSGPDASRQGGRAHRSARRAGVKIDPPLSKQEISIQRLANSLAKEEEARLNALDTRTRFEKKYNIEGDEAHLSPEDFFKLTAWTRRFQSRGITRIYIRDMSGSVAKFEYDSNEKAHLQDGKPLRAVAPDELQSNGLFATLKNGKVLIKSKGRTFGWLEIEALSETAPQISQKLAAKELPKNMNPDNNFADLFHSRAGLKEHTEKFSPVEIKKQFTNAAGDLVTTTVGYARIPTNQEIEALPVKPFSEIWGVSMMKKYEDQRDLRRKVFGSKSAILVCADNDRNTPIAVLTLKP